MSARTTVWLPARAHSALVLMTTALLLASAGTPPPVRAEALAAARNGHAQHDPDAAEGRCEGELRLVASVVIEARPDLSMAMVRKPAGTQLVTVGGRVDGLRLLALEPERAHFRSARGQLCTLSVFSARTRSAEPAPSPAAPQTAPEVNDEPKGKALFTQEELARGVREAGHDTYRIARPLFLRGLANPGGAASGAYFRPVERDGRTVGMEVRGVRSGSVLSVMGLRTGDVVRSVNGVGLDSPLELLGVLRTAREAEAVTLVLTRGGQEHAFRYLIDGER